MLPPLFGAFRPPNTNILFPTEQAAWENRFGGGWLASASSAASLDCFASVSGFSGLPLSFGSAFVHGIDEVTTIHFAC